MTNPNVRINARKRPRDVLVIRHSAKRCAFTLIELLVVVSIIALLIAILLPSLTKARELSRAVACGSNVKQIGLCLQFYGSDNRQFYPYGPGIAAGSIKHPNDSNSGWNAAATPPQQQFFKYTSTDEVFICPSDPDPTQYYWWAYGNRPDFKRGSSYMFSEHTLFGTARDGDGVMKLSDVYDPMRFAYAADGDICPNGWSWGTLDWNNVWREVGREIVDARWGYRIHWTHLENVNMLYGDMHVELTQQAGLKTAVRSDPRKP
jgi:prepilin-type N-terminal cleavage/methylation domain-containing protein